MLIIFMFFLALRQNTQEEEADEAVVTQVVTEEVTEEVTREVTVEPSRTQPKQETTQ